MLLNGKLLSTRQCREISRERNTITSWLLSRNSCIRSELFFAQKAINFNLMEFFAYLQTLENEEYESGCLKEKKKVGIFEYKMIIQISKSFQFLKIDREKLIE